MSKQPEPKRFTSKIEITPVNPFESNPSNNIEKETKGSSSDMGSNGSRDSSKNLENGMGESVVKDEANFTSKGLSGAREIPIPIITDQGDTANSPQMGRHRTFPAAKEIPVIADSSPFGRPRTSSGGNRRIPVQPETNQSRSPYDSPNAGRKQPQVRHIPIFVEGRQEPVISKHSEDAGEYFGHNKHQEQVPVKRKLDNSSSSQSAPPESHFHQQRQQQHPPVPHEVEVPVEIVRPATPASQQTPPAAPPKPKDPMERIDDVKAEVDDLAIQVDQFDGNSRADKGYLFLDEMLTRNLIKLDTIEVEGNDTLRSSRKQVIKLIQATISKLESKVSAPEESTNGGKSDETCTEMVEQSQPNLESNGKSGTAN